MIVTLSFSWNLSLIVLGIIENKIWKSLHRCYPFFWRTFQNLYIVNYPVRHEMNLRSLVTAKLLLLLLSHFSHVLLCATPKMAAHQASPSLGFSRQEHWSGLPFPSPMHESEKWKWSLSVVSDTQRPHGLQPSRLLHPWDFPGKSTGVGCHCLLCTVK